MTSVKSLECFSCGQSYSLTDSVVVCNCGGILDTKYNLTCDSKLVLPKKLGNHSIWRFANLLPIIHEDFVVSLGEGMTPTVKSVYYTEAYHLKHINFKLEFMNPTGSFKDRGTSVEISKFKEDNVHSVLDDSSGNAGSSLAAYCTRAGIDCTVFIPESSRAKSLQAKIYGAKVTTINGSRSDVGLAAQAALADSTMSYASHNTNPYFLDGMKTMAYELATDLRDRLDHIVIPVGGGALFVGLWKGFRELKTLGIIDRLPKLHCVQSEACKPIVNSFLEKRVNVEAVTEGNTIASGIRIANPPRGNQVLQALNESGGKAVAVSDAEIFHHQKYLASKEGVFAEPTSCAAIAGMIKLINQNEFAEDDVISVPLTGSGFKDLTAAERYVA